jgi:hypothetical protein
VSKPRKSKSAQDVRTKTIGKLTITMIDPAMSADGLTIPSRAMVRYETPSTKNDDPITVIGNFVPATFTVTGWRYPITFTTAAHIRPHNFTQLKIDNFTIHAGGENLPPMASTELVRDLPIGRILKAAAMISSFVANTKPRGIELPNKTIYPARGHIGNSAGLEIIEVGADILPIDLIEMVSGSRKTKRENKPAHTSLAALKEIAKFYKQAPKKLSDRNGLKLNEWIASKTLGNKNTIQKQITLAVNAGLIKQSHRPHKPRTTKRKRGTK